MHQLEGCVRIPATSAPPRTGRAPIQRGPADKRPLATLLFSRCRSESQAIFQTESVLVPGLSCQGAAVAGVDIVPVAQLQPGAELGIDDGIAVRAADVEDLPAVGVRKPHRLLAE